MLGSEQKAGETGIHRDSDLQVAAVVSAALSQNPAAGAVHVLWTTQSASGTAELSQKPALAGTQACGASHGKS